MPALSTLDGADRNRRIEGREASSVRDRQREQINVGYLAMPLNMLPSEASTIAHARRIGPKQMIVFRAETRETRGRIGHRRARTRVGRIGEDPDQGVFRERASRPFVLAVEPEPYVRRFMMDMRRIKQRDQDVDVEKCYQAPSLLSLPGWERR
jgi:hypothetical protein